ncbi:helix-turn-helix domain-containing protein [Polyangium sorediatum]|uniref:Helix-turn-helix transcriptional regulator n=1 Tax=Polyangium sorediatum TaxID=889274 RepID=A0ABT6PA10_9BACT|nr:helix-turn-helix transcriptional regulator [Polyangium sorediatum]MDI1437102.1 helix-turn-helix transcriptional regulator [Polyangium sorediatum]
MPRRRTTHPFLIALGARVRDLRLDRQMTLSDLADASGVTKGALSSIENGRVNFTIETCVKIAVGLGLRVKDVIPASLEDLLGIDQESGPRSGVQERAG